MKDEQISRTAILAAIYRNYHSKNDDPKIFDDYKANELLKKEEIESFERQMIESVKKYNPEFASSFADEKTILAFLMQSIAVTPLVLSRAKYAEEALFSNIGSGIKQYVILGAGLDTFAYRYPAMLEELKMFEVDHPATQDYKIKCLSEAGLNQPEQLYYISIDFAKESLASVLCSNKNYDKNSLSFFNWLGVSYYLPSESVFETLRSVAEIAPKGSLIVFDYLDADAFDKMKSAQRVQMLLQLASMENECMDFGIDPLELSRELNLRRLRLKEDLGPKEIQTRYFLNRSDNYYACEHAHFAIAEIF